MSSAAYRIAIYPNADNMFFFAGKWPHLTLDIATRRFGDHVESFSLADRYWPWSTNLPYMRRPEVLRSNLLFSFSIVPLDHLKHGHFWPSLPKGNATVRVMPFPFAIYVTIFQPRYSNNQRFGEVPMLLRFYLRSRVQAPDRFQLRLTELE